MSKFSKFSKKATVEYRGFEDAQVVNFMEGISYRVNPLSTLKIVAGSSIFGEPSYYRDSHDAPKYVGQLFPWAMNFEFHDKATTTDVFAEVVDNALNYDFKATLDLAAELRHTYFMRLNPAFILVRAAMHKDRVEFARKNGNYLRKTGLSIILRPDDITNQFDLFMYFNKSKNGLPSVLKRIWKEKLEGFTRYQLNKYKSSALIDLVRICHARNEIIDELMKTGKITVSDEEKTWENLRSANLSWPEIFKTTHIPHMALLRNLRNILCKEKDQKISPNFATEVLNQLKAGVEKGKQFPFRYFSAYNEIKKADCFHSARIQDALEECLDISIQNFPKMRGKTICLSDNSGSAWGAIPSEYGSVTVAQIANLSSIITALQSDEGYVGVFGDELSIRGVSQRNGILTQLEEISDLGKKQGQLTEHGIWLFFSAAIAKKEWYDHIFIYSDMQAGHGRLFGDDASQYTDYIHKGSYIDVLKLILAYRKAVNPKVNIYSVQVAGYDNSAVPENLYRTAILTGWTGKEVIFANYMQKFWDEAAC